MATERAKHSGAGDFKVFGCFFFSRFCFERDSISGVIFVMVIIGFYIVMEWVWNDRNWILKGL